MKARQRESQSKAHILVVEDEQDLRELICYNLERDGFVTSSVESGEQALKATMKQTPDLVVLDLMLPGIDGLEVCRTLRADSESDRIPIVMLTAKGEESDIVAGLELGADDYVTKPFSPRVLSARLKAVLRRGEDIEEPDGETIVVGSLTILPDRHEVRVGDQAIELTATEFDLMTLLAGRPGRVFTRAQIIQAIHGDLAAVTDRSVDVQVVSLRRKLGLLGEKLQTVRGVGYRFNDD